MSLNKIVLIGMMGCGKTTFSKLLSQKLNLPCIDMDTWIENHFNQTITQLFDKGEPYFRECETLCAKEMMNVSSCIISTGGGVIMKEINMDYLKKESLVIYIDRPIENILKEKGLQERPLLKNNPYYLYTLYDLRHPLYLKYSDYRVINDTTIEETLTKLMQVIQDTNAFVSF